MAPNFLSKFVKANGSLAPNDGHARSRTSSDASPLRGRTLPAPGVETNSGPPSLILTSENSNSPIQPSTPGSLHRSGSHERRARSASLTPSTPRKEIQDVISVPQTASPESALPANLTMGLGIDLGQHPQLPEPAVSHTTGLPKENNGFEDLVRRKLSSRSLKSLSKQQGQVHEESPPILASQEVEVPPKAMILVESPTSDSTPTTAGFPTAAELDGVHPSTSTTSQASLQPYRDSDAASISSAVSSNKKMPWRRGSAGSGKKRKPTGLASAIAASGLAMANPAVAQSLAHFAPAPSSPPPSNQAKSPPRTSYSRPRGSSEASHSLTAPEEGDHFYSDLDSGSEDELDLDDEIPVTGFAVASNKRNADFHEMFQQVPEGDYLIEDYGCALQREILIQGRLYISENHICFHANIFGWITDLIIPVYEIISIEKRMTALFIPNALQITTRTAKYTFASFLSRDTTYDVIHNIWRLARPDAESIRSGDASTRVSLDNTGMRPEGGTSTTGTSLSPTTNKITECKCGNKKEHYPETAMSAVFPGTPEKIYNLMFASGFIKDFMREDQNLKDLQISDWVPDPETQLLSRKFSYIKILNGVVRQTKCELLDETVHCDYDDYISTLTTTRTPDVPSGSAFSVKTRTCLMWASSAATKVVVTTQIEWTGRSFIKSMINSSALDGQKQYHTDLERAMRKYIAEHKNEFIPEGMEDVFETPVVVDSVETSKQVEEAGANAAPISDEEANKRREQMRNQRATQWAFDTCMGAWKVAKQSTLGAIDLISDAWDQSSSTTILYFVIVVLVLSNLWTLVMVGRREEVGRRKERIKMEDQKKWVASIVAALSEERQVGAGGRQPGELFAPSVPTVGEDLGSEIGNLNRALDIVEERIKHVRKSLQDLD